MDVQRLYVRNGGLRLGKLGLAWWDCGGRWRLEGWEWGLYIIFDALPASTYRIALLFHARGQSAVNWYEYRVVSKHVSDVMHVRNVRSTHVNKWSECEISAMRGFEMIGKQLQWRLPMRAWSNTPRPIFLPHIPSSPLTCHTIPSLRSRPLVPLHPPQGFSPPPLLHPFLLPPLPYL